MRYKQEIEKALEQLPGNIAAKYNWNESDTWQPPNIEPTNISSCIDHTLLKVTASKEQVQSLCKEAKEYSFYSVCVNPAWLSFVKQELSGSDVKVAVTTNFPLGATTTKQQITEIKEVVGAGADEIDYVFPFAMVQQSKLEDCFDHLQKVKEVCGNRKWKVILETSEFSTEQNTVNGLLSFLAGADFLKTSTGFAGGGATKESVSLLREIVGSKASVKASGGIRDFETAKEMILSGANRLGCSAGVRIVTGKNKSEEGY